jgi:uncharacterized damage-inducible protein DinB
MLAKEILLTLIDYDDWATGRVLELAAGISAEQAQAPAETNHGCLHSLLFHIIRTTYLWRNLMQSGSPPEPLQLSDFPDIPAIQGFWLGESERLRETVARLSPTDLAQEISIMDPQGKVHHLVAWHMLVHTLLHAMQHRSEAAVLLTKYGCSPGDLDFIFYV